MAGKGIVGHIPDYDHLRCDECGGVIGTWDRTHLSCTLCGKYFVLYKLDYDELKINPKTGWAFPVKYKTRE